MTCIHLYYIIVRSFMFSIAFECILYFCNKLTKLGFCQVISKILIFYMLNNMETKTPYESFTILYYCTVALLLE